jgi:hypothetical protein
MVFVEQTMAGFCLLVKGRWRRVGNQVIAGWTF